VSAKLAYYLIGTPTLGLGLVLYYDVMSLVTILATKTTLYQQNFLSQQKALVMTHDICCVSNNVLLSRSTTYFDPTLTYCLSCVDFDRHLVSVSSSGAHFDCCAYIIDLTQ